MPTINQLIRNGRKAIAAKPTAPYPAEVPAEARRVPVCQDYHAEEAELCAA